MENIYIFEKCVVTLGNSLKQLRMVTC
jgi:hypothetical protein